MSKHARPLPSWLVDRYRSWRAGRFTEDRAWLHRLAEEGQRPRTMVIACCDSRVDVTTLFSAEPGEFFVVRNVANIVPPYQPDGEHHGTSAALEYAVLTLRVTNIVVLGHADCGGVNAYMRIRDAERAGEDAERLGGAFIRRWLDILDPAYGRTPHDTDPAARQRLFERTAVAASLDNLRSFPFVRDAVAEGRIATHGAWFDISNGELLTWRADDECFVPVIGPAAPAGDKTS